MSKIIFEKSNVSEGTGLAHSTSETAKNFINCAPKFIRECYSDFKNETDFQERVLHIKNGLILRCSWNGSEFDVDLYDDKNTQNVGEALEQEHVDYICDNIEDNINSWYILYVAECMRGKEPIYLPGCRGLICNKTGKYYTATWENGKMVKKFVEPFDYAIEMAESTKRFWME